MAIPTYYKDSKICGGAFNFLFQPGYDVYWQPECFDDCWYIDAFTVDPSKLATEIKGIWDKKAGRPPEILSNVANANVGTLPKVMVYIACHKEHGTRAFFLYHGAKHGGKASDKANVGRMYDGFAFWHRDLTNAQLEHIKSMSYYSGEGTLNKFEARVGAAVRKSMQTGPFDPCFFLVCPSHCTSGHLDSTLSASSCQNASPFSGTSSKKFTGSTAKGAEPFLLLSLRFTFFFCLCSGPFSSTAITFSLFIPAGTSSWIAPSYLSSTMSKCMSGPARSCPPRLPLILRPICLPAGTCDHPGTSRNSLPLNLSRKACTISSAPASASPPCTSQSDVSVVSLMSFVQPQGFSCTSCKVTGSKSSGTMGLHASLP